MSGKKGMQPYPDWMKEQVRQRVASGESQREKSLETGISRYTIQSWCGLRPETKMRQIAPLSKGSPRKNKTIADYMQENKRLQLEIDLLRGFLSFTERM